MFLEELILEATELLYGRQVLLHLRRLRTDNLLKPLIGLSFDYILRHISSAPLATSFYQLG